MAAGPSSQEAGSISSHPSTQVDIGRKSAQTPALMCGAEGEEIRGERMAERQKRESKTYENQTKRESQPGDLKSGKEGVKQGWRKGN